MSESLFQDPISGKTRVIEAPIQKEDDRNNTSLENTDQQETSKPSEI